MVINSSEILQKFKIKYLTPEQIVLTLDRLTRFKATEDKYLKVFKNLILQNLITPKFSKKDLDLLSFITLRNTAQIIFNESLKKLKIEDSSDFSINEKLLNYENSLFKLSSETNALLENRFNYKGAIGLLNIDNGLCKNLVWLKHIENSQKDLDELRTKFKLHFPIRRIIITEGITEEILLPIFAQKLNYDFDKHGIHILSAGGKNQVVKLFYSLKDTLKIPVFILLDKDANENKLQLEPKLREIDKIHLLNSGEFEDLLPHSLIIKTLNHYLKNFSSISEKDFPPELSTVKILEEIFKEKGLHEFKKVEFAGLIAANINEKTDISKEIFTIFEELKSF